MVNIKKNRISYRHTAIFSLLFKKCMYELGEKKHRKTVQQSVLAKFFPYYGLLFFMVYFIFKNFIIIYFFYNIEKNFFNKYKN